MDYIIKNGWIVNGKNEKPFYGDLAVKMVKLRKWGSTLKSPLTSPENVSWMRPVGM